MSLEPYKRSDDQRMPGQKYRKGDSLFTESPLTEAAQKKQNQKADDQKKKIRMNRPAGLEKDAPAGGFFRPPHPQKIREKLTQTEEKADDSEQQR